MWGVNACLLALLLLAATNSDAQAQRPSNTELLVVEERDAVGLIDKKKIADCIHLIVHELHAEDRELPKILVYHVSQESANYMGVGPGSTWRTMGNGHFRYEIWLIGEPSNLAYAYAVESVLHQYLGVSLAEDQRAKIVQRVVRNLNATVNVKPLR